MKIESYIHAKADNQYGTVCKQVKCVYVGHIINHVTCPKCLKTLEMRSKRKNSFK